MGCGSFVQEASLRLGRGRPDAARLARTEVLCGQKLLPPFSHVKSKNDQSPRHIPNAGKASPILIRI